MVLTPGFAPYEQYHRRGEQGIWTDVYSCGATLYTLITGKVPPEATERKEKDELVPPEKIVHGISPGVSRAVMKALALDPGHRPQGIREFQDILTSIPNIFGDPEDEIPEKPDIPSPKPPKPVKKGIWLKMLAFLIPVILLSSVYFWWNQQKPDSVLKTESVSVIIKRYALIVKTDPGDASVSIIRPDREYSPGIRLEPGSYEIEVSADGYRTARENVDIRNDDLVTTVRLEKIKWGLTLNTTPAHADVQIVNPGRAYYPGVRLEPGEYDIEVSAEGYKTIIGEVEITDSDFVADVVLKKDKPGPFTNKFGMKFVYITPGKFRMGSPSDEPGRYDNEELHRVTLTKGYFMQTTEVTQGQWKAVMGSYPPKLYFKKCGDNCPVERVSWDDVQEFIKKLNRKEGMDRYRLPTEAEWEYAARAGTSTAYSWGDKADCGKMMYENDVGSSEDKCVDYVRRKGLTPDSTAPVMSYASNFWGLYDMHGNVWEWCRDWYGDYPTGSVTDPTGPRTGSSRVLRGGCWYYEAGYCRSAYRLRDSPVERNYILGLRLALSPGQQQ